MQQNMFKSRMVQVTPSARTLDKRSEFSAIHVHLFASDILYEAIVVRWSGIESCITRSV